MAPTRFLFSVSDTYLLYPTARAMHDLTPERWQQIDALFEQALEYATDERAAFLRQACGNDQALFQAVYTLLHSADEAALALGDSATQFAAPLMPGLEQALAVDDDGMPPGTTAGPYQLLKTIGRGGMGAVYLAERADGQFEKQVALKLVKRGMDTDEILRRFRHERQILAALEHPNIARLYDGGLTSDGRPYLVMEYVDGVTIDQYCNQHRLSVDERLRLFESVFEAVQFAHRNLVVHRDLKPSNIMVDEDGQVKLLDFGIAKLLSDEEHAVMTQTGVRVMTPEYAAPEQMYGAMITTATDVYALGVVLYELLTGHRPHGYAATDPSNALQQMTEHDVERPSTAVARPAERRRRDGTTETVTPEAISQARATSPDRLRRRLRGDLDMIVLKALRVEPERRYPSAEAFLEDVKRHLAGLPVQARPDAMGYRMRKFMQRHRFGVTAAAAFLVLAASFTLFYTTRVTEERDRAQAEADKARAATVFMENLFNGADPNATLGDTLNVFELLDRGRAQIDALHGQPALQATVQHTLGLLHLKLGAYEPADSLLTQALHTRQARHPGIHAETAQALHSLAHLKAKRGAYEAADSLFQQALAMQKALVGPAQRDVALVLNDYGQHLGYIGQYARAKPLLYEALTILDALPDDQREAIATAQSGLGAVYMNEANYKEAEPLLRQALDTRRDLHGDVHTEVAATLDDLGNLLTDTNRYVEAQAVLTEALEIRRLLLGEDHPDVSLALNNLSLVYYYTADYETAEAMMREALAIKEKILGREHRDIGMTLNNIAWVVLEQGNVPEAEALFRESLGIMQRHSGRVSADAGLLLGNVAHVLRVQGAYAEAEPFFREALDVRRQVHGDENMHVAYRQFHLAEVLRKLERFEEAEALHRDGLALRRTLRDSVHTDVVRGLLALAGTLIDQDKHEEAAPLVHEALATATTLEQAPDVARARTFLGACLAAQNNYSAAENLLLEGYRGLREHFGEQDEETRQALHYLVALYAAWGKPEEAAPYQTVLSRSPS